MPFCPNCRNEFRAGVNRCPDCETDLVPALPEEKDHDFVEVFTCNTLLEAEHLKAILEENGIEVNLRMTGDAVFPTSGLMQETRLVVLDQDAEQAIQILKEVESLSPTDAAEEE